MKFGRRHGKEQGAGPGVAQAPPAGEPADPGPPAAADPSADPVPGPPFGASWPAAPDMPAPPEPDVAEPAAVEEPIVEGEAFELFTDEPPAVAVTQYAPPPRPPEPAPFPVAEQPVAVATPDRPVPGPVTPLGDAGATFASGHAEMSGHAAGPGPPWQEHVTELANERPEIVVAAAFAGGLVAAMILRRLGN